MQTRGQTASVGEERRRRAGTSCPAAPAGLAAGWVGDARGGLFSKRSPRLSPPAQSRINARKLVLEFIEKRAGALAKRKYVTSQAPATFTKSIHLNRRFATSI